MNIKDFILNKDDTITTKEQPKKHYTPPEYTFTVEYENDTDFILKKSTKRTEKLLVVLVSQGQIYIKDVKQNTIEKVTDISQIYAFKRGMPYPPTFQKLSWTPFVSNWSDDTCKTSRAFDDLLEHTEEVKVLANKKLNPLNNPSILYSYMRDPDSFLRQTEYLKIIHLFDVTITPSDSVYTELCKTLRMANIDYNMIKTNLDTILALGVNNFKFILRYENHISIILNDYGVDFKTFITYLTYTIKNRNGLELSSYSNNAFCMPDYTDYLRMQKEMYGKVKEKYPDYWLSEKQMMNNKYNTWKRLQSLSISTINQEDLKKYEFEDSLFKVVVPQLNVDILDEAQQQQHCLASYLTRITEGKTHIVFIRTKLNPDESLLTVEITPDERIVQVRGFQNRSFTAIEYSFIKNWVKEKNLNLEV